MMSKVYIGILLVIFSHQMIYAQPDLVAGSIGDDQEICYSSASANLVCLPTGGTPPYYFQWQRLNNGSTSWTDIYTRTNQSTLSPPVLSSTTRFRVRVTDSSSGDDFSNEITISVLPNLNAGSIGYDEVVCPGFDPNALLQLSEPTGGAGGNFNFQWQSSDDGYSWEDISGATEATHLPSSISHDTWYRRLVTDTQCGTKSTKYILKTFKETFNIASDSLFRNEIPDGSHNDSRVELGSEFEIFTNGLITKARLYTSEQEGGEHLVRLWKFNGSEYEMQAGPFAWTFLPGIDGWREYEFPVPIPVIPGTYIISISNSSDQYQSYTFNIPAINRNHVRFIRGLYSEVLGTVPDTPYGTASFFRDIVFVIDNNGNLTPGLIGNSQSICYNTVPTGLTQLSSPSGGNGGDYSYQWQSSADNLAWTNIPGANSVNLALPAMTENTYFRRVVQSGSFCPVFSNIVHIYISSPPGTNAQLHDDITIYNNTSTLLRIEISGSSQSSTVSYKVNDIDQPVLYNYRSQLPFSTGVLTSGTYNFSLTSVIDENGCPVLDLGDPVTVTVLDESYTPGTSNKALVLINTGSDYYQDYDLYIRPYLDNFGIPYDTVDVDSQSLFPLTNYSVIILGHKNVYTESYPLEDIKLALSNGVGLYSFDPHLFDFTSEFNTTITPIDQTVNTIDINNVDHYITQLHDPDIPFNSGSNAITLRSSMSVIHNSILNGGSALAQVTNFVTIPLLQISGYESGRIVKWSSYDWVKESYLGPISGMDDLIWRGIVWAAKKPFILKGMPPMITMRVDDVNASGTMGDYEWIEISNEFGIVPWCGLMIFEEQEVAIMKSLIDEGKMTAAPHAFFADNEEGTGFIFYNHTDLENFDPAQRTRDAKNYFVQNNLQMSKYLVAHYYEISSDALEAIREIGIDYIGTIIPPDYLSNPPTTPWINGGPYRIGRDGFANQPVDRPIYYAGKVIFNVDAIDYEFFNCLTEIRDEGSTDWYVSDNISFSVYHGVRRLRRALNSMIMPTLFTHYYYLDDVTSDDWRNILTQVAGQITAEYGNIDYKSMDEAIRYIVARENLRITNVNSDDDFIFISYEGDNDMDTKYYLFTENELGEISYILKTLPMITTGDGVVTLAEPR